MSLALMASGTSRTEFVNLDVPGWAWPATIAVIIALLLIDILILNRTEHAPTLRRAVVETIGWVAVGPRPSAWW